MLFGKKDNIITRTIKQHGLLETIFYIFLIFMGIYTACKYSTRYNKKEGFDNKNSKNTVVLRGPEIYNSFYVEKYDLLHLSKQKLHFEVNQIHKQVGKNTPCNILDIGSGIGHHINKYHSFANEAVGIDISPHMVEKANSLYPNCNIVENDALNPGAFPTNIFSHISCLSFTIYYMQNKHQFFTNSYNWLQPGGKLIVHLVDPSKFSPMVPNRNPFQSLAISNPTKSRNTKFDLELDDLSYMSKYDYYEDEKKCEFNEKITDKITNTVRLNEHVLYMPRIGEILEIAKNTGFIVLDKISMDDCNCYYQYLYVLQKPT